MKHYVTFGQSHVHRIGDAVIHKDLVVRFDVRSPEEGMAKAFKYFGPMFCLEYSEEHWDEKSMVYFPAGYLDLELD